MFNTLTLPISVAGLYGEVDKNPAPMGRPKREGGGVREVKKVAPRKVVSDPTFLEPVLRSKRSHTATHKSSREASHIRNNLPIAILLHHLQYP